MVFLFGNLQVTETLGAQMVHGVCNAHGCSYNLQQSIIIAQPKVSNLLQFESPSHVVVNKESVGMLVR